MCNERKDVSKEYLMMRDEIIQYLEQYQTVRNMMYIATGTLLGFGIEGTGDMSKYLFLLPLIVIIPSYIIAIDYWKCVRKASAYLVVFYEQENDSIFHWESRHGMLGNYIKPWKANVQLLPYYICGIACFVLYFCNIDRTSYFEILIGISLFSLGIIAILLFKVTKYSDYINAWKNIKYEEARRNNKS